MKRIAAIKKGKLSFWGCLTAGILISAASAIAGEVEFQQGLNGYVGVKDTHIWKSDQWPSVNSSYFGDFDRLSIGGVPCGGIRQGALIRFDDIFGDGYRIPTNSTIVEAKLLLYQRKGASIVQNDQGRSGCLQVFKMLTPFYADLPEIKNNDPMHKGKISPINGSTCFIFRKYSEKLPEYWGVDNKEEDGPVKGVDYDYDHRVAMAEFIPKENEGWVSFDVTSVVKEWVADPGKNHGLYIYGSDYWSGASFNSSDFNENTKLHPKLVVKYN